MTDRAEDEAVAVALGAMACTLCGGLMETSRVKFAPTIDGLKGAPLQTLYRCPRCDEKASWRPEHEAGCFCADCLR